MAITYQCCFCGQAIESRLPDVGGLLYMTAIDGDAGCQQEQQFYCHTNCLRARLDASARLYVLDLLEVDEPEPGSEPR